MIKFLKYFLAGFLFTGAACAQTVSPFVGGVASVGYFNTYSTAIVDQQPAASATDINCITGSATRLVILKSITFSGSQGGAAAVSQNLVLLKRSTADTGGTPTAQTMVPYDSQEPSASAAVTSYVTNPTTGTLVGNVVSAHLYLPQTGTATLNVPVQIHFGLGGMKGVTLRGTSEQLCVNLNGSSLTSGALHTTYEWIEQ